MSAFTADDRWLISTFHEQTFSFRYSESFALDIDSSLFVKNYLKILNFLPCHVVDNYFLTG